MYKEFAKAFLDVAKYILTAVIISASFSEVNDALWFYVAGFALILFFSLLSIVLFKRANDNDKNTRSNAPIRQRSRMHRSDKKNN